EPRAAASMRRPMIESPETVCPSRVTQAAASCASTVSTNFAEARACRPFSLTMVSLRETAMAARSAWLGRFQYGCRRVDVLPARLDRRVDGLGQLAVAHLGELDEQRQVRAVDHLDPGPAECAMREIRGRAAEHVGDDHNA